MPQPQTQQKESKKKWMLLLLLLLLITLASVIMTVATLLKPSTVMAPEYAPQSVDGNAEKLPSQGDADKLATQEGGGAVSLTYSTQVTVDLSDGQASLLFQNPARSTQDVVLQLVVGEDDQETLVAQSQLIPVGYSLDRMELEEPVLLTQGGYRGEFRVLCYDPGSGEKAVVNTVIPVDITVQP